MEEILQNINYWLTQAYVIYPALLSFITGIIIPTIIKFNQSQARTKTQIENYNSQIEKANAIIESSNKLNETIISILETQIQYNKELQFVMVNKKQKNVIGNYTNTFSNMLNEVKLNYETFGKIQKEAPTIQQVVKKIKIKVKKN